MQLAAKSFAVDRELARRLYGQLGRPPGPFARAASRGFEQSSRIARGVGHALLALSVIPVVGWLPPLLLAHVLAYPIAKIIRLGWVIAGDPIQGRLEPGIVLLVALFVWTPAIAIPAILFRKEREIADVRRDVHASLAAGEPERPGGPSLCRNCGGALDVPGGALGVQCTYCRADNLVALPKAWVAHVRTTEFRQFLRIDAALEAYRLASERARDRAWRVAFYFLFLIPITLVIASWLGDCSY